ncbi:hypothetical protein IE53DRAFT_388959 [Violaceomyces palustris]|uniref:Uncharacterized protein n=1 Tax=Violaceomyces palustris TaxID=1673888 RepID=A0ACD0NSQ5_9BASI|nr:hypothetical protein IE53DRAFT_388959 [Violaceomyces palustris]
MIVAFQLLLLSFLPHFLFLVLSPHSDCSVMLRKATSLSDLGGSGFEKKAKLAPQTRLDHHLLSPPPFFVMAVHARRSLLPHPATPFARMEGQDGIAHLQAQSGTIL